VNYNKIIDSNHNNENIADSTVPSHARSVPGHSNGTNDNAGENETQAIEIMTVTETEKKRGKRNGTWKGNAIDNGKGIGKQKQKGQGTGKGNDKQLPSGDDISCWVPLQLEKEMYQAYSDVEG
jgi:hypothetical protein